VKLNFVDIYPDEAHYITRQPFSVFVE